MQQEEGELEVCVWCVRVRMCGVPVCEDALSQVAIELYLAWLRPTVTVLSYNKWLARELCSSSFPDATIGVRSKDSRNKRCSGAAKG